METAIIQVGIGGTPFHILSVVSLYLFKFYILIFPSYACMYHIYEPNSKVRTYSSAKDFRFIASTWWVFILQPVRIFVTCFRLNRNLCNMTHSDCTEYVPSVHYALLVWVYFMHSTDHAKAETKVHAFKRMKKRMGIMCTNKPVLRNSSMNLSNWESPMSHLA